MRFFRNASIRAKLNVLTGSSVLLAVVLTCGAFAVRDIRDLHRQHSQRAAMLAEMLGANVAAALDAGDSQEAHALLASLRFEPSIEMAVIYNAQGKPFLSYRPQDATTTIPPQAPPIGHTGSLWKADQEEIVRPIAALRREGRSAGEPLGMLYLRYNLLELRREIRQHQAIAAVVLLAAFSAAMIMANGIQRVIAAPVHSLVAAAQRVTQEGDFRRRVPKLGDDEHGVLCDAFNAMLERIAATQHELQQAHNELEQRVIERTAQLELALHEATAANRAKSAFLANMSHEIRTPMTAILGYADLLLEEDQISEAGLQRIETIRRNGGHLLAIINDILDVSKIEAGKMTVERIECSVCRTLADVVSLWRARAAEKGLALCVEHRGPIPELIRTDPVRLNQILTNLVGNAIKFTQDGEVRLTISLDPTAPADAPRLQFDVSDTGLGMTPEQLAKIFQPFTQGDETMTRRFGGTGLGLTIVQRLAQLLGGEARAASEPGRGSCFTVTVATGPLDGVRQITQCREAILAPPSQATGAPARLPGRVLLVEDGLDNQRLISFVLRRAGAEVQVAVNGQEGFEAALAAWRAGRPFDVVLMDMQMPVLDGYQATARLREAGYPLPIVALTAHAMSHDREKCLKAGCNDYLSKPIDKRVLLDKIVEIAAATTLASL